jgi:molybdopterin molybdotransferase
VRPYATSSPYRMVSVDEAISTIVEQTPILTVGQVAPWTAEGRVLAEDVASSGPLPAEPRSAVDGYAVRAADNGARLLLGEISAGPAGSLAVGPGQAVRIMTGGVVPEGADAVAMVEDSREENGHVLLTVEPSTGSNVHPIGNDLESGQVVVRVGTVLGPAEIGLLATLGVTHVGVYRRPRVAVLATGDELVEPWETPPLGCIRDSNRYALMAAVRETGAEVVWHGIARDEEDQLAAQVRTALSSADVLITSGGVSMGTRDLIKPLLESLGTVHFGRVNFKPGKPLTFASVGQKLLFGLPGYPVSSLVTFEVFVRPSLRKMGGHSTIFRPKVEVEVEHEVRPDQVRPAVRAPVASSRCRALMRCLRSRRPIIHCRLASGSQPSSPARSATIDSGPRGVVPHLAPSGVSPRATGVPPMRPAGVAQRRLLYSESGPVAARPVLWWPATKEE